MSKVPPAITIANGGQKPPPPSIKGKKPPTVVIVVEEIWRPQLVTAFTIADVFCCLAFWLVFSSVSMTIAPFTANPTKPKRPIMTVKPNG